MPQINFGLIKSLFSKTKTMFFTHVLCPLIGTKYIKGDDNPQDSIIRVPHSYFNTRRNPIRIPYYRGRSFLDEKNSEKHKEKLKKLKKIRKNREKYRKNIRSQLVLEKNLPEFKFANTDDSSISSISVRSQPLSEQGTEDIRSLLESFNSHSQTIPKQMPEKALQDRCSPKRTQGRNLSELFASVSSRDKYHQNVFRKKKQQTNQGIESNSVHYSKFSPFKNNFFTGNVLDELYEEEDRPPFLKPFKIIDIPFGKIQQEIEQSEYQNSGMQLE